MYLSCFVKKMNIINPKFYLWTLLAQLVYNKLWQYVLLRKIVASLQRWRLNAINNLRLQVSLWFVKCKDAGHIVTIVFDISVKNKEASTSVMGEPLPVGYRKSTRDPRDDSTQQQTGSDKSCLPRGSGKLTMTWKGARSVRQLSVDMQLQASSRPEPRRAVCLCVML
jgi:hypothetical protein